MPPDLGDLEQWYNSDVPGLILPKFGNLMVDWPDQSSNMRNLTSGVNAFRWGTWKTDGPNGHGYLDMGSVDAVMFGENFSSLNNAIGYTFVTVYRTNFFSSGFMQSIKNTTDVNAGSFRFNAFGSHVGVHRRVTGDTEANPFGFLNKGAGIWGYDIFTMDTVNQIAKFYPGGVLNTTSLGVGTAGNMEAVDASTYYIGRQDDSLASRLLPDITELMVYSKALSEFEVTGQLKPLLDIKYDFIP